ncbi:glycoside hydrolase family 108 protein [Teredinibacter haidensis]|uniref:glycoside hydrolase family 108 protein n=1 Tax=Teredinibacter haidensis TaxID=2731755 RepID=UPI0009491E0A|nr:glycosyl hydrolase 108 family protein [Teredinibacter haidensis]
MANFDQAFKITMKAEGGYINDPDDPGGETYKGIARSRNPKWPGWINIDLLKNKNNFPKNLDSDADLEEKVKALYEANYWDKVQGDHIGDQDIAESIFDFAVNAGPRTSAKLAQMSIQTTPDGVIGPKTLAAINADDKRAFLATFALAKISRYVNICENRKTSRKYFYGWVRRTLEGM